MASLQEAQNKHYQATESNRDLGVIEYKSGEKQSDQVWEVTDGLKYLPGGKVLGPGMRFHPTERQVRQTASGKGGLTGKARELTNSEKRDLKHARKSFAGADFGEMGRNALYALEMADSTVEYAIESGLTAADFDGVEPDGANSRYTRSQVEAMVEARGSADA